MSLPPFEQVVAEQGAVVLRVCRAVAGAQEAEDAWSETFLAALSAYPTLRPDSNIRGWLVTIAHRKAIDRLRARQRAPIALAATPEPDRRSSDDATAHELPGEVWQAVAALPARQRAAVAYRYIADLSYAQIAEVVGGSEAAARRAAADGLANLRLTFTAEAAS